MSIKDAWYNDLEDGNNKEAITSSKVGDGVARVAIVEASSGKFGHRIAVKATVKVKDKVTDGKNCQHKNSKDASATRATAPAK